MTTTEAAELLIAMTLALRAARAEAEAFRLVACAALHRNHELARALDSLRQQHLQLRNQKSGEALVLDELQRLRDENTQLREALFSERVAA